MTWWWGRGGGKQSNKSAQVDYFLLKQNILNDRNANFESELSDA